MFLTQKKIFLLTILMVILGLNCAYAQFTLTGQLRTRSEIRDGQGRPLKEADKIAFFTSQRTRLNFGWTGKRLKFMTSIQDVRVWGQDASSINRVTYDNLDGTMLHEAWGEVMFVDSKIDTALKFDLSLKLGRQEIVYDEHRLLGNLDWLQQGRRHDAAVLKFAYKKFWAHFGGAFNQNSEKASNTIYDPAPPTAAYVAGSNAIGAMYKAMFYSHLNYKFKDKGNISFLFFDDMFTKTYKTTAGADSISKDGDGVNARFTTGLYFNYLFADHFGVNATFYYQGGKTRYGKDLGAYMATAMVSYQTKGGKFKAALGFDMLSGTDAQDATNTKVNQFDPLYCTPHKWWGYMDYFYVASGFGSSGLINPYIKFAFKPNDKWQFNLDLHYFMSAAPNAAKRELSRDSLGNAIYEYTGKNLGTEFDITILYSLNKYISFELGYSGFMATESVTRLKYADTSTQTAYDAKKYQSFNNWAFLSINLRPDFLELIKEAIGKIK